MAVFPQAPLDAKVSLQLTADGPWTDITTYALQRAGTSPPVQIGRGRPNERATYSPAKCAMQWNNRDGRFSPRNPTGPYYGQLGRNTPVRVSVPASTTFLRLEDDSKSYISAPDAAGLHITGDLDIRIDLRLTGWQASTLAAKWVFGQQCWLVQLNTDGTIQFWWSTTGSNAPFATSTMPLPLGRGVLRITLQVSTGTVTFYTAAAGNADAGPFTQLGNAVVTSATSVFAGTAGMSVGNYLPAYGVNGMYGQVFEFELRNGIAGTVAAHPVFTAQTAGATSFTDAQSNTWTVAGTAELSARSYRFHGECSGLPQSWDLSGTDVWTPVQGSGILRRLQQASAPVLSAVRRGILSLSGTAAPVAYWPCEDLAGSTQLASGLNGGLPMTFSGSPQLASSTAFACSQALPVPGTSVWTGSVPAAGVTWTDNQVRFIINEAAGSIPDGTVLASMYSNGTVARTDLVYKAGGSLQLNGYNASGTSLFASGTVAFGIDGTFSRLSIDLIHGASITWEMQKYAVGDIQGTTFSGTVAGSIGAVTAVHVNPNGANLSSATIGHITVQAVADSVFDLENNTAVGGGLTGPLRAWAGEAAGNRFYRLCTENGIAARVYGPPLTTAAMGSQAVDTLANLLQACEDADHGMIYEPRQCLGIGYRTLVSLCNQPAQVIINYAAGQLGDGSTLLAPTDDDQFTVNDWTVTNVSGSSVRAELNDGSAMSVSAPPAGVGDYTSSKSLNLYQDSQLSDQAGWMLHVSTVNEERYPGIPLHLARTALAGLFYSIQETEIGDYIAISNPPAWLPPGTIKQLVSGTAEQLGGFFWQLGWQCIPESPYETGITDDLVYGRADTDGSTLVTGVTSGATSLSVATTNAASPLWTTAAGDFPFDINLAGERMTVTGIAGDTKVGAFLNASAMGEPSYSQAVTDWGTWTGNPLKVSRQYYGPSSFPQADSNLAYDAANGIKCVIDLRPAYNPTSSTDLANLGAMLSYWKGQGLQMEVTLWAEPFNNGLTSSQFITMFQYYGPTVRNYCPVVFCTNANTVDNNNENSFYPGDSYVDKVATDLYAWRYLAGDTLATAAQPADNASPPKPFGLFEFNGSPQGTNFLTGDSSTFEVTAANWTGSGNASVARTTAQAHTGVGSLAITSAAAGTMNASHCASANITTQGMPCTAGDSITCGAWVRAATVARSVAVGANFYTSGGVFISSLFGTSVSDSTTGWTNVTGTVVAPATAAFCRLDVEVLSTGGASEVHYADDCSIGDLNVGQSQANITTFWSYLQTFFTTRLSAGKQNADIILFNSGSAASNITTPIISSSDFRVALMQAMYTALNNTSGPQTFTVTRSVNGVVKAQTAGTDVRLYIPPITALI